MLAQSDTAAGVRPERHPVAQDLLYADPAEHVEVTVHCAEPIHQRLPRYLDKGYRVLGLPKRLIQVSLVFFETVSSRADGGLSD